MNTVLLFLALLIAGLLLIALITPDYSNEAPSPPNTGSSMSGIGSGNE